MVLGDSARPRYCCFVKVALDETETAENWRKEVEEGIVDDMHQMWWDYGL